MKSNRQQHNNNNKSLLNFFEKTGVGLAILFIHVPCFSTSIPNNINHKVNVLAYDFMEKNRIKGLSIAVIKKGKAKFFNYGFSNESKKLRTTNKTIYTLASFTKTFTGTLAAVATVEGKVDLNTPFATYFPELKKKPSLNTINLTHLLGHTAALPFDFNPRPKNRNDIIKSYSEFAPLAKPGSRYSYSNASIGTAGYILQNVYLKNYEELLQDKILKPLHMENTFLNVPANKERFIATGHNTNNSIVPYEKELTAWFAAASLKSTITDIAKYLKAHMNPNKINNNTLKNAMPIAHKNYYCFDDMVSCEQLAWQAHIISELNNSNSDSNFIAFDKNGAPIFAEKKIIENNSFDKDEIFIDKTESGYGMSGYMAYIPGKNIGVVILSNKVIGDERVKLGRDILKAMHNQ